MQVGILVDTMGVSISPVIMLIIMVSGKRGHNDCDNVDDSGEHIIIVVSVMRHVASCECDEARWQF